MNLLDCLTLPIESNRWGERINNPGGALYFRDNDADVLAIAHLDHVEWTQPRKYGPIVKAPQLDDRLGVWVLLNVLPRLGVKVDVLLTDNEEVGDSTGQYFEGNYNWMFEFDRRGTDVVMYHYEEPYYLDLLEFAGFEPGWGSFSDISLMDHLGVVGFNFGTGYCNEHTCKCYADLRVTMAQAKRFAAFWQTHKREYMPIIESASAFETTDEYLFGNSYWEIEEKSRYYGYTNSDEFIQDGGLQLLNN